MSDPNNVPNGRQFRVDDPEQLTQAQRIRSLLDRRKRVIDSLEATTVAHAEGAKAESDSRLVLVANLRSLIMDLHPVLLSSESGSDWIDDCEIGSFAVEPPGDAPTDPTDPTLAPGYEPARPKRFEVNGLDWFLNQDFPIGVEWTVVRASDTKPRTISKEVLPPLGICVTACKETISCMNELGIDADVHEDSGTFGFNYDEISDGELESEETIDNE